MLARLYIAGTGVGFNVPVMIRHALFSSKSATWPSGTARR